MLHLFQMCQWLESEADAELYTSRIACQDESRVDPMFTQSSVSNVYTIKRLKQKLHEQYEDFICRS